jgi:hypothetical protein
MSSLSVSSARIRPTTITAAVILSVLIVIGNLIGPVLSSGSGDDQVPTFIVILGVILGIAGIAAAIGLWQMRKWGMILTVILMVLNLLSAAPGVAFGQGVGIKILAAIGVIVPAAIIVLVLLPESRRAYR